MNVVQFTERLLDMGADVNSMDSNPQNTPLFEAVEIPNVHIGVVRCLLRRGADPNLKHSSQKNYPLHAAAEAGNPQVVSLLLHHGADPTALNGDGLTPLLVAVDMYNDNVSDMDANEEEVFHLKHVVDILTRVTPRCV